MRKASIICFFSVLSIVTGLLIIGFSFYFFTYDENLLLMSLCISFILVFSGLTTHTLATKRKQLIHRLTSGELPVLSRWLYKPTHYQHTQAQLHGTYVTHVSLICLIGLLTILLLIGVFFNNPYTYTLIASIVIGLIVLSCLISYLFVYLNYRHQLNHFHECIITTDYFYFNNTLYSLYKGLYHLTDVELIYDKTLYIHLIYTMPGTSLGPYDIVYIPVPEAFLDDAKTIVAYYHNLLST